VPAQFVFTKDFVLIVEKACRVRSNQSLKLTEGAVDDLAARQKSF
jgi:hypothetical protein